MRGRRVLHSSERMNYGTERPFFDWLDAAFGFTVDCAAEPWSAKCDRYWTEKDNALVQDWSCEVGFDNPPYGDAIGSFLEAAKEGAKLGGTSAHVVPSRVDTDWFRRATEQGMGKLRRSMWHQRSRVLWLIWAEAVVGIYHHDKRLIFELPAEEREARIKAGKNPDDVAPFPTSVIIYDPPLWRKRIGGKRLPTVAENLAAEKKWGRPLITSGRPR